MGFYTISGTTFSSKDECPFDSNCQAHVPKP
jgi:hypothetical protein